MAVHKSGTALLRFYSTALGLLLSIQDMKHFMTCELLLLTSLRVHDSHWHYYKVQWSNHHHNAC